MSHRTVAAICIVIGLAVGGTLAAQAQKPAATPTPNNPGRFQFINDDSANMVFDTQTGLVYMQVQVEGENTSLMLDLVNARLTRRRIQTAQ